MEEKLRYWQFVKKRQIDMLKSLRSRTGDLDTFIYFLQFDDPAEGLRICINQLESVNDRRFWIDHQNLPVSELLKEGYQPYQRSRITHGETPEEQTVAMAAFEQATINPESKTVDYPIQLSVADRYIIGHAWCRSEPGNVLHDIGFWWDEQCRHYYIRTYPEMELEDFLAECYARILKAGCPTLVFDEVIRAKVLNQSFKPQPTDYIDVKLVDGLPMFLFKWAGYHKKFSPEWRMICHRKYEQKTHTYMAYPWAFDEVEDFANTHGFAITKPGRDLMDTAKRARQKEPVKLQEVLDHKAKDEEHYYGIVAELLDDPAATAD